ncbi:MAG: hypothetical protein LBP59_14450 [Planctomycetaceae bacterium]|jgi:hypothetical protein|nr:hypothetical protein [Planctomycetaceae bacterium]
MRLYSTANERGLISQQPFCLPFGKVQARRPRSVGLACISGSQALQNRKHFAWCLFRFAGGTPASLDRGRLACKRLYSTANERGLISQPPCLPFGKLQARQLRSFLIFRYKKSRAKNFDPQITQIKKMSKSLMLRNDQIQTEYNILGISKNSFFCKKVGDV